MNTISQASEYTPNSARVGFFRRSDETQKYKKRSPTPMPGFNNRRKEI